MRSFVCASCLLLLPTTAHALPDWTSQGLVAPGRQFAADVDPDDRIHIIAERYVQTDLLGNVIVDEADVGDTAQGPLDMYPAIALGPDGAVHVVTRNGGSPAGGNTIRYAARAPAGGWSAGIDVGQPVPRNYVVGVAAPSGGRVLVTHGRLTNDVAAEIDLYEIEGGVATLLGSTPTWLRTDNDYRLVASGNAVVLASGTPGPGAGDPVHFAFAADADADVLAQWDATHTGLLGGAPRRGGPSLFVDETGRIHMGYGGLSTHHYARFEANGAAGADTQTMDGLGEWHLSFGNGAVVASPDGMRVLAVALQNLDGDQTSAAADLLFAESIDGGATFGPAQPTGFVVDGGEGRMRPRLFEIGGTLALLYRDNAVGGIALATSPWFEEEPEGTGSTTDTGDESGTSGGQESSGSTTGDNATAGPVGTSSTSAAQTGTGDASGQTSGLVPPSARGDSDEGCGCHSGPRSASQLLGLLLLGLARRRRRK